MKRSLLEMLAEFRRHWKNYLAQSALAALVTFVVVLLLDMEQAVIVASIGSTLASHHL